MTKQFELFVPPPALPDEPPRPLREPWFADDTGSFSLYEGDCMEVLDELGAEQFDMIFADPPYFLSNGGMTCKNGKMVPVDKGKWDASRGAEANHAFNRAWLARCQRALKPNGTIFVSGTHHTIHSIGFAMQQLGFKILNDLTWFKPNPPPNLSCRYFTHTTETIIWAGRSKKTKHLFNYKEMKVENGGKQMRSMWNMKPPNKAQKSEGKHPTMKPLPLLDRIVRAASNPGDRILDPFNGSGTTGLACAQTGRNYVGIEMDESYLDLTRRRLLAAQGEVEVQRLKAAR
jgi:site-specific DNA-methyltransferase (adenine-specific)